MWLELLLQDLHEQRHVRYGKHVLKQLHGLWPNRIGLGMCDLCRVWSSRVRVHRILRIALLRLPGMLANASCTFFNQFQAL